MCLSILKKFVDFKGYSLQVESTAEKKLEGAPQKSQASSKELSKPEMTSSNLIGEIEFDEDNQKNIENKDLVEKAESEGSVELM